LSLSRALRRYISLPIVSDQSAQLVPGLGGDTISAKFPSREGLPTGYLPFLETPRLEHLDQTTYEQKACCGLNSSSYINRLIDKC
jgi:hypothetical protein